MIAKRVGQVKPFVLVSSLVCSFEFATFPLDRLGDGMIQV